MNRKRIPFEEAALVLVEFAAEDILTESLPRVDEVGNIILPSVPFED